MTSSTRRLAVLGSTGSIGRQTLDVVRALGGRFQIVALAAGKNSGLLAGQIAEFAPRFVYSEAGLVGNSARRRLLSLEEIASHPDIDVVVIATSGRAGLGPTLAAVRAGKQVALANKEALVAAGEIITREARKSGARLLPIDSEHSAIWQCLRGDRRCVRRILLTASGGPFRGRTAAQMERVSVAETLAHPSWRMGPKVTVDSATLMNKGLEVIEAHWLFGVPINSVKVLVHPQSVIHSMVEFVDGSVKAQLSYPDMRLPIQYALTCPDRLPNPGLPQLDWESLSSLTFESPDLENFPCLRLAIEAGKRGGTSPAVLCGADEAAVGLFLAERISFTDIPRLVGRVLDEHQPTTRPTIDDIRRADAWASERVIELAGGAAGC